MKRAAYLIVSAAACALFSAPLPAQSEPGGGQAAQPQGLSNLEGRIVDSQALQLPEGTVGLRMQTRSGAIVLLDLGSPQKLGGLNIQPGSYVLTRGFEGYDNAVPVFYVSEIAPVFLVNRGTGAEPNTTPPGSTAP